MPPPPASGDVVSDDDPFTYLEQLTRFGIKLGLEPMHRMLDALGAPHHAFRTVLVAGTNGKGSVAALVERGLRAAGHRTGRYTSPHLVHLTERFAIDGRDVASRTLAAEISRVRDVVERLVARGELATPPTFFEAATAAALSLFRHEAVDTAVLEVGMGGRFDATNVVHPIAVGIPSIDRDHERYLGPTLAQIAFEKAGVIKRGSVVVTAEAKPEPRAVLRAAAHARGARLVHVDREVTLDWHRDRGVTVIDALVTPHRRYGPLRLSLRGRHQLRNAAVAVRLLEELDGSTAAAGPAVPADAIVRALTETRWPGRLDLVVLGPGRAVLLDAAHNVAAATALAEEILTDHPSGLPFVLGTRTDKDVAGIVRALGPAIARVVCTTIDVPRTLPLPDLVRAVRAARPRLPVTAVSNPVDALDQVWRDAPLAVAAGSVYLVGQLVAALGIDSRGESVSREI